MSITLPEALQRCVWTITERGGQFTHHPDNERFQAYAIPPFPNDKDQSTLIVFSTSADDLWFVRITNADFAKRRIIREFYPDVDQYELDLLAA